MLALAPFALAPLALPARKLHNGPSVVHGVHAVYTVVRVQLTALVAEPLCGRAGWGGRVVAMPFGRRP